ncbi:hypothetical protein PIB30_010031 [Stylosanthes scabra]|uniref:Uncharacterized protein n=1 Tax=Stylosanthes scabra TaxID=79078 RepID=A0ABU6W5F8_9FABA|nr:hypothetical protein [Stylosanthes scabra]
MFPLLVPSESPPCQHFLHGLHIQSCQPFFLISHSLFQLRAHLATTSFMASTSKVADLNRTSFLLVQTTQTNQKDENSPNAPAHPSNPTFIHDSKVQNTT